MDPISVVIFSIVSVTLLVLYRLDLLPSWPAHLGASNVERNNPYPAVSIRCAGGCDAAQELKGCRFLGGEAPALPLAGCNAETCSCRYVHHVDRRTGILDRRGKQVNEVEAVPSANEDDQREGRGRRASDWIAAYQLNIPQA